MPYDKTATAGGLVAALGPNIKDKVVLTTGVSPGGLGATFVEAVARAQPSLLILAARDAGKAGRTAAAIEAASPGVRTRVLSLDLGSLAAVRAGAAEVNAWDDVPAVDVLVNNAGIMAVDYRLTPDGHESQFATNHLAHFLFTNLVAGKLLAAPAPRVVSVSSDGHRLGGVRWADYDFHGGETYDPWVAYGQSKTANILFALSLAEKLGGRGLLALSLHPGVIATNLGNHVDWDAGALTVVDRALGNAEAWTGFEWKTADQGAATHVYAAFDPELKEHNGAYLQDGHVADPFVETVKPWATSAVEAERLWRLSEKLVGQEFRY